MKKMLLLLGLLAIGVGITGCKALRRSSACLKPGAYVGAQNVKPLVVPEGLDAPDTRGALRIPELKQPARARTATDGCLDAPPKFAVPKETKPAA
jgi:uncharacterized lipoprotein